MTTATVSIINICGHDLTGLHYWYYFHLGQVLKKIKKLLEQIFTSTEGINHTMNNDCINS